MISKILLTIVLFVTSTFSGLVLDFNKDAESDEKIIYEGYSISQTASFSEVKNELELSNSDMLLKI
jgi:hypothetical protein